MMLYNTQITKAQIRLRGCAGWSALLLFAAREDRRPNYSLLTHTMLFLLTNISILADSYLTQNTLGLLSDSFILAGSLLMQKCFMFVNRLVHMCN